MLALAVAAGIVIGVWLQPALARVGEHLRRTTAAPVTGIPGADVL